MYLYLFIFYYDSVIYFVFQDNYDTKENYTEINIENIKNYDDFVMEIDEDNSFEIETKNITCNQDTNITCNQDTNITCNQDINIHENDLLKSETYKLLPGVINTNVNISLNEIRLQGITEEQNTKEKIQGNLILI